MAKDELDWTADPFHTRFESRADGSVLLQPQDALPEYPARLMDWLEHWAGVAPERTLVARRAHGGDWQNVSYCEMLERVHRVAAGLARRNLSAQRPILIASGNSIEHLVLSFAAMWVGIPFCPMSAAYSRRAQLLPSAPSLDHGEVTDKGSINQRAVLRNRAQLVATLYASVRLADVIDIDEPRA